MRITSHSIFVDDQDAAVAFYRDRLGFVVTADFPVGEHRWITLADPENATGTQIVLEPNDHPAVPAFTSALVEDGIPFTSFGVEDAQAEYERLTAQGVVFTQPPTAMGPVITAVLDDTVGNLIQLAQMVEQPS
ncbi:VOC family protein [Microbacterium sp. DT81.1]|uniref:VOC family protein n=1 Tax=Microbacterium sp. DT81.1 TaxID=3393413 RepID=UPI003CE8A9CE